MLSGPEQICRDPAGPEWQGFRAHGHRSGGRCPLGTVCRYGVFRNRLFKSVGPVALRRYALPTGLPTGADA